MVLYSALQVRAVYRDGYLRRYQFAATVFSRGGDCHFIGVGLLGAFGDLGSLWVTIVVGSVPVRCCSICGLVVRVRPLLFSLRRGLALLFVAYGPVFCGLVSSFLFRKFYVSSVYSLLGYVFAFFFRVSIEYVFCLCSGSGVLVFSAGRGVARSVSYFPI